MAAARRCRAMRSTTLLFVGLLVAALCNCSKGGPSGPAPLSAKTTARTTFESVCSVCHGMRGLGDGPGSATLDPKPRNLSDPAWQRTVNDQHIRNVITMGGAAVGKSPIMPAHPFLKNDAQVLDALVAHIRGLTQ